jgi:hypothetical protein
MVDGSWATVGEMLRSVRVSNAIVEVLRGLPASPLHDHPTADLSCYVQRAIEIGRKSRGDANRFLFEQVQKLAGREAMEHFVKRAAGDLSDKLAPSRGLEAAFQDAVGIRSRTGGRDDYIGARHVLVAILTSPDPAIVMERGELWEALGGKISERAMAPALGGLLRSAMEEDENPNVWLGLLNERGFEVSAREFITAPPKRVAGDKGVTKGSSPDGVSPPPFSDTNPPPVTPRPAGDEPAVASTAPTPQADAIAGFLNDNPWSVPLADLVGVDAVADALARLIAAKDFQPPLAVGVFGAWGSGKSLLMRRMHAKLDLLQSSGGTAFHDKIVQISFNAWHYVDTDLWASLAGSIFEELDAYARSSDPQGPGLLGQLTTARKLTLDAARGLAATRQATRRAELAVQEAEAKLARQRSAFATSLEGVKAAAQAASAAGKTWLAGDKQAREAVQSTYGRSLEEMAGLWASPQEAIESLRKDRIVWLETARRFGRWRTLLGVLVFAGLCLAVPYLAPLLAMGSQPLAEFVERLRPVATAATGLLTALAVAATGFTRRAMKARDAIVAAMEVYQTAKVATASGPDKDLKTERDKLQAARDELERARSSLDKALGQQAAADVAFAGDTPAGRLRSFVEARASADGPYRTRQGLVSTIRRDFRDLAALMNPHADAAERKKREEADLAWKAAVEDLKRTAEGHLTVEEFATLERDAQTATAHPFSRIVLYIDDLDRCPPAKVLEVLQAVHLLLAHSLFVVVVAVDVRWLTGALQKEYADQFESDPRAVSGKAAALDYLEKIFQLPVWTEAMPAHRAGDLVRSSLEGRAAPSVGTDAEPRPGGEPVPTMSEADGPEADRPIKPILHSADPDVATPAPAESEVSVATAPEALRLAPFEIDYLVRLAERLGCSPRRLLRMANTYRVARAGVGEETSKALLAGGYRGFGLLLGLAAAHPKEFPAMTADLAAQDKWSDIARIWRAHWGDEPARDARLRGLVGFMGEEKIQIVRDVRPYIALANRFSFTG